MSFQLNVFQYALHTKWLPRIMMLFIMLAGSSSLCADTSEEDVIEEYQIKSVFMYNFANYFTWPATTFNQANQPFRICVLGKDPFGIDLDLVVEGEDVEGRKVAVQRIQTFRRSSNCQVLFVSESQQANLTKILAYVKRYPILTVSDVDDFAVRGGMVEFFNSANNEVLFKIVPKIVKEAKLIVSANLLEIAQIVRRH